MGWGLVRTLLQKSSLLLKAWISFSWSSEHESVSSMTPPTPNLCSTCLEIRIPVASSSTHVMGVHNTMGAWHVWERRLQWNVHFKQSLRGTKPKNLIESLLWNCKINEIYNVASSIRLQVIWLLLTLICVCAVRVCTLGYSDNVFGKWGHYY